MAAPATTVRTSPPAGIVLDDGYQTLIAFAADTNVSFWEKTVQPPGLDGGDPIDKTTMHNITYRTMTSASLITLTPSSVLAAYDPNLYNNIIALVNVEGAITVNFPDGSTLDFYGFLQTVEFADLEENVQPECTVTIQPTNWDPTLNVEEAPVLTSVTGT